MSTQKQKRVLTVGPMPAEKSAYALARYSRSPDSIAKSLDWVRTHDSQKFLESFYFQYGHASIADLGHIVISLEGISELAATEIEDEPLWDGQARSSRYQDFAKAGLIIPPEFDATQAADYQAAGEKLLNAYRKVHEVVFEHLRDRFARPVEMDPKAYERNLKARAFDVARYLLFFGVPTSVGQVTSIRTLEKQIRRIKASEYAELRELGDELAHACAAKPDCPWDLNDPGEPVAPTLARHVEPDQHLACSRDDLRQWASQNLPPRVDIAVEDVELYRPSDTMSDAAATLLYTVTDRSYRELYELTTSFSTAQRQEIIDTALRSRTRRDELLRAFRGGPYVYDIVMDIGAYRDLHRHRRCQQFRQDYGWDLGYVTPPAVSDSGVLDPFRSALDSAFETGRQLSSPGSHYLLPFATRARFLFKMDFAEAEYICRLRSGVKGHFSYREIAWKMKVQMEKLEPDLGKLMHATPPWIEDPLTR